MPHRRDTNPVIVNAEGISGRLERVPLNDRTLKQEGWLQTLLDRHPELLPIE